MYPPVRSRHKHRGGQDTSPADPGDTASAAMRTRIRARFADLHAERQQLDAQLRDLAQVTPKAADTTLLEELPLAGDILPGLGPDLKAALFDAFDLQVLWNKTGGQATVHVEITEATLQALPGILNPDRDGYDDNAASIPGQGAAVEDLFESPMAHKSLRQAKMFHVNPYLAETEVVGRRGWGGDDAGCPAESAVGRGRRETGDWFPGRAAVPQSLL